MNIMKRIQLINNNRINHYINISVLLVISLIIFKPFISSKYVWGHDSFYHYANILATSKTISFSKLDFLPTRIIPIIAYNFGWGEGIFYPSIPEYSVVYLYKIVNILGITNIFTSMKIIHFIMYFLSGITMYMLGLKIYKNSKSAFLCSIFYITFPYYYIDIFVRDALNECFLFAFIPLIFLGIEYLFEGRRKEFYFYFIFSYFVCINCHLVLSLYLSFFVIIYLLLNIKKVLNFEIIKCFFVSSLVILGLSSFYLIPLLLHTINANYVVYLKDLMTSYSRIKETTVNLKDFFDFSKPKSYTGIVLSTISIPCLISFVLSLFFINKNNIKKKILSFIVIIIIIIFIMSPLFPWKYIPKFLWNIQFVWRLNTFLLFFICLVSGLFVKSFKNNMIKNIIISFFLVFSICFALTFKEMLILENFDVNTFNISKSGAASFQYIPVKAYKNMEYVKNRSEDILITKGEGKISNIYSNTPYLSFDIETKGAKLELPRYYFKIYDIIANGERIKYEENNNGFIQVEINKNSKVIVKESSRLNIFLIIIFITSLVLFSYLVLKSRIEERK